MWEDNIKMGRRGIRWGCLDWIVLSQDRDRWRALVNPVMNLRVPSMLGISISTTGGFSRRAQLHGVSNMVVRRHDT
jgi:hypothetical protein